MTLVEIVIVLPLIPMMGLLCLSKSSVRLMKQFSLYSSFVILGVSMLLWVNFNELVGGFQFVSE